MIDQDKPDDWAFVDLALGFHLRGSDIMSLDPERLLRSGKDWARIAAINIECRSGDFSKVEHVVPTIAESRSSLVWAAGIKLLGFAGSWATIVRSFEQFVPRLGERSVRFRMAYLLGAACDVRAVHPLLDLYRASERHRASEDLEEDGDQAVRELSMLLEPMDDSIFFARNEPPASERLSELVEARLRSVSSVLEGTKLFEAEELDIVNLAKRLRQRLELEPLQRGRFERGRLVFEAATGIDCAPFFDEGGGLNRLAAMGILDEFFETDLSRFAPGQRYFFGNPIPD